MIEVFLMNKNEYSSLANKFPIKTDGVRLPEELEIVRHSEFPSTNKFYKLVHGITLEGLPLYFEIEKGKQP